MRRTIAQHRGEAAVPSPVSSEEMEKLAALGYIGFAGGRDDGPHADPKDKIPAFRALQAALRLAREGKNEEALAAIERLLEKEPEIVDLWDVRAKTLLRLGRVKEGIASSKEALRRNPAATHIAADLANALLLDGQLEEARKHAELALTSDPAKAHSILARVGLARNDLAGAEREARAAINAGGAIDAALYTLATVQHRQGNFAAVVETTSRLPAQPPPRGLSSLRGDALARMGRQREAEAAFRSELALFPDNDEAARRLVLLLVTEGRNAEATEVIRDLAESSPHRRTYLAIAETLRIIGDENGARYWGARAKEAS